MNALDRLARWPVVVLVVVGLLMQGCTAGTVPGNYAPPVDMSVLSVQASTVAYGIAQCLKDAAGTQILVNGQQILFTWGYEYQVIGMFGIDLTSKTALDMRQVISQGGGMVNAKSASDLLNWMKANGWEVVTGAAVADAAKVGLLVAMERFASAPFLALYMILPVDAEGSFDLDQLPGLNPPQITS